jgi:predicted transcriptional regulator
MPRTKVREVTILNEEGGFSIFKKKKTDKSHFDFESLLAVRQLLTNEKARVLHVIKNSHPKSIYQLAKILKRSFKAVNDDVKLLRRFGFIEFIEEKTKKRIRHRPVIVADTMTIHIKI